MGVYGRLDEARQEEDGQPHLVRGRVRVKVRVGVGVEVEVKVRVGGWSRNMGSRTAVSDHP